MKPLHDQARRVILEGRSADVSPPGSQARNWQALVSRLDAPLPPAASAVERALRGRMWQHALIKFAVCGALLGGLSGGLALYGRYASARSSAVEVALPRDPVLAPAPVELPPMPLMAAAPSEAATPSRAATPVPRARRAVSGLAAETRLIAQAQGMLSEGGAARALALLEQHRSEFPRGELVPEREAARVLALCALGRTAEAKAVRAHFERVFSSSPLLARVRASCASVSP